MVTMPNKANYIDNLNSHRRQMQDDIFKEACKIALDYKDDDVLVINGKNWNHGIIGILAAKILEKFKKPVYILAEDDNGETKVRRGVSVILVRQMLCGRLTILSRVVGMQRLRV